MNYNINKSPIPIEFNRLYGSRRVGDLKSET